MNVADMPLLEMLGLNITATSWASDFDETYFQSASFTLNSSGSLDFGSHGMWIFILKAFSSFFSPLTARNPRRQPLRNEPPDQLIMS